MAKTKVIFQNELCKGCELCVNACPKGIIQMNEQHTNAKGYHIAFVIEEDKCTGCTNCAIMCPDSVISVQILE